MSSLCAFSLEVDARKAERVVRACSAQRDDDRSVEWHAHMVIVDRVVVRLVDDTGPPTQLHAAVVSASAPSSIVLSTPSA